MIDMVDRIGEQVEYDEAERRRRLGQVYSLLLEAARQKRAREAQAAAAQTADEVQTGDSNPGGQMVLAQ